MSGSPRSGSETRFSTPEPDLDDHRHQPETLPRAEPLGPHSRRGTLASLQDDALPLAALRPPALQFLDPSGSIARDFEREHHAAANENAIADDDASSTRSGQRSPIVARRATHRRLTIDPRRASGESSRSRSTSPPNSVDAFAAPQRRRRAGTMTSDCSGAPSIQRTLSSTTRGRRRPTFSDVRTPEIRANSITSSVQDDVCFPPLDSDKMYTIDFDELDEFVSQPQTKTPVAHPHATVATHKPSMVFNDLRRGAKQSMSDTTKFDSSEEAVDEKVGVDDDTTRLEALRLNQKPTNGYMTPSQWTFFSSEADETIHAPEMGGLTLPGEGFRDLFELGPEGGVWWLDMVNPSEEEIEVICKAFGIHPLTREDIATGETREKVELFKQYYFVCFRTFHEGEEEDEKHLEPLNVYAVVFREGLLTFSFCPNQHAANVRKRIGRLRDYVNLSADWICYALIDEIVDAFAPLLHDVEVESDTIEDNVFISRVEDAANVLKQIGLCRKRVMSLSRLLSGKADVIKGFAKRCNEQYSITPRSDVGLYLSDVQDHVVTMMSNLAHFEKMLSRSHSNYLAQISMTNITQGNKANQMLNKITVLATILVPLNLVAGLFGMNVDVPGRSSTGLGWFFGILGCMLCFSVCCVTFAKRMRFI